MTARHILPFNPLFDTFNAPRGTTLPLRGMNFSLFASVKPHKPDTLAFSHGLVPRRENVVYLSKNGDIPCLTARTGEQEITAHNWAHLADQLEQVQALDFPEELIALFRQVGGVDEYRDRFVIRR